jgi:hypothetical protein
VIKTVFYFRNGNVAVCDDAGAQMAEYQGSFKEKREAILRDAPENAQFNHWLLPDAPFDRATFAELTAPPGDWEPGG